ncbi:hypothetical protein GIB67_016523 [Kingdonia uniflora]|uniref:Uncharacterized protein n=1 Tax=Kingdonia uniflora TaxID=39325 RepID=A0A7J7NQJ1_9MAGN|nr:hypothetical protein GIB67_016523 [Kingdonia uniflora]
MNPEYVKWQQLDQSLLSWVNATLTPSVLSTVARYTTSRDVWLSLEKRYASQSRSRIMQLKNQLYSTKPGNLSISYYLDKMNGIVDNLALAGKPVEDDDVVTIILNNVGQAFEATVNLVQAKESYIGMDDLTGLHLSVELRHHELLPVEPIDMVLFTNRSNGRGCGKNVFQPHYMGGRHNHKPPPSIGQTTSSPGATNTSSGYFNINGSSRPNCDICGRIGHTDITPILPIINLPSPP